MIGSQRSSSLGSQLVAAKRFCLGEAPRHVQRARETGAVDEGAFVRDLRRVVPSRSSTEGGSRRRRGHDVEIPRRSPAEAGRGGAAATM